jgi:hypothetical protein
MSLSWLRRNRWPLLRCGLFALALGVLGWALYAWLPLEPRWTADGITLWPTFAPDSARVLTVSWTGERYRGPMHVRDLATGRVLLQWGERVDQVLAHVTSADFRRWVGVVTREGDATASLSVVNLDSGEERVTPFELERGWVVAAPGLVIAPRGGLVAVMTSPTVGGRVPINDGRIHLAETDTGRVLARLPWKGSLVEFTPDGRHFLHEHYHDDDKTHVVGVWDTEARQTASTVILPGIDRPWMTGDGKALQLTDRGADGHVRTVLFDLPSGRRHELVDAGVEHFGRLSPDGRLLAATARLRNEAMVAGLHGPALIVFDVATGKVVGAAAAQAGADVVFSDDGRRLVVIDEVAGSTRFRMIDTATFAVLWEKPWPQRALAHYFFTPDRTTFVVCSWSDARVALFETESGEIRGDVPLGPVPAGMELPGSGPSTKMHGPFLNASSLIHRGHGPAPPKNFIIQWLEEWLLSAHDEELPRHLMIVIDTRTGRTVFHSEDDIFRNSWLSPDGHSLLVGVDTGSSGEIRCYDVPERRPLRWAIGIPLALGVLSVSIRGAWRRWRGRPASDPLSQGAPPCP